MKEEHNSIETVTLQNVLVQRNGIIRNEKGYLIGRLVDGVDYQGEHVKGLHAPTPHTDQFEEIRKEFIDTFELTVPLDNYSIISKERIADWWLSKLHHIRRETEKGMMDKIKEKKVKWTRPMLDTVMEEITADIVGSVGEHIFDDILTCLESDNSTQK